MIHAEHEQVPGKVFRTAHMGVLFTPDIDGFFTAFQKVLESASVRA